MIHPTDLEVLTRNASMSADMVAIGWVGTEAAKTRAMIQRAIEALEANGFIEVVPPDQRPEWFVIDPPFEPFQSPKVKRS